MAELFLTGANGYVGRALAARFKRDGYQIRGLVRESSRHGGDLGHIDTVVWGDLSDPAHLAQAMRGVEAVIHCAGSAGHEPIEATRQTLIAGGENVIRAAQHAGAARVVVMSCADVTLANCDRIHWDERRKPSNLLDEFVRSKALAEDIALTLSNDDTEVVALRPAQVWGLHAPWLEGLRGEAMQRGIFLPRRGETLLATTHIDHLVEATTLALKAFDVGGRAFYVTDGEPLRAVDFFSALSQALGWQPPQTGSDWMAVFRRKPTGAALRDHMLRMRHSAFDVQNAVKYLGFQPAHSVSDLMAQLSKDVQDEKKLAV